jgi:hypothetical protein
MTDQVTTKVCSKCKIEKGLESFTKKTGTKDGLSFYCKECVRHKNRQFRINNPENNPEKKKASYKKWAENNPEKKKANNQKWAENNPEKVKASYKKWAENNPEKVKSYKHNRTMRLSDGVVAKYLGIKLSQCPQELIELKRINLLITREIRNQQQCQN